MSNIIICYTSREWLHEVLGPLLLVVGCDKPFCVIRLVRSDEDVDREQLFSELSGLGRWLQGYNCRIVARFETNGIDEICLTPPVQLFGQAAPARV